jgi:hypothetical protein
MYLGLCRRALVVCGRSVLQSSPVTYISQPFEAKSALTAMPEIEVHTLKPSDEFLVLASDGVGAVTYQRPICTSSACDALRPPHCSQIVSLTLSHTRDVGCAALAARLPAAVRVAHQHGGGHLCARLPRQPTQPHSAGCPRQRRLQRCANFCVPEILRLAAPSLPHTPRWCSHGTWAKCQRCVARCGCRCVVYGAAASAALVETAELRRSCALAAASSHCHRLRCLRYGHRYRIRAAADAESACVMIGGTTISRLSW